MTKRATLALLFASLFLPLAGLFAQTPPTPIDYAEEVKASVYNMMEVYKNLPKTKNKEKMLAYFDKSYVIDRIRISLEERVEQSTNTYMDLERLFTLLSETPGLEVDYRIDEVIEAYGTENVGYCLFKASYEAKRDGSTYVTGNETVTYFFRRIDGAFRVVRAHSVQVRDQINRAGCPCNVYKSEANLNAYLAQIEVPSGTVFLKKIHTFSFGTEVNGLRIIDVDGIKYSWESGGDITILAQGVGDARVADGGKTIGKARKPLEAIVVIFRDYMYKLNCSSVNLKQ